MHHYYLTSSTPSTCIHAFFFGNNVYFYGSFSLIWVWNGHSTEFMHILMYKLYVHFDDHVIIHFNFPPCINSILGQKCYVFVAANRWNKRIILRLYKQLHILAHTSTVIIQHTHNKWGISKQLMSGSMIF